MAEQTVSQLLAQVEYDVESTFKVSTLLADVEYDTANPSLVVASLIAEVEYTEQGIGEEVSHLSAEVEYTEQGTLQVANLHAEVEYVISPSIVVSQLLTEVEYDTADPQLQASNLLAQVEYDESPNLIVSSLLAQVEFDSTDTPSTTQTFTNTITEGTAGSVSVTQTFINGFLTTLSIINDWYGNVQTLDNSILNDTTGITQTLTHSILTYEPVRASQINSFSILADYDFDVMTPTYQILLDGMDVSQKIMSCNITYNRANFVGECSIVWKDWTLFNQIDCSDYTKNYKVERIEVKTRLLNTDDWTSHGTFFIEKRDTAMTVDEILPTSWGRNKPAILGEPFATTITKTWDYDTTAKAIALEVINGLCTLDWQIMDYPIYTGRFSANKERPIAIINRLAQVLGGIVTTDKQGRVRVIYEWQM